MFKKDENIDSSKWKKIIDEVGGVQNSSSVGGKEGSSTISDGEIDFDLIPEELESYLNKYVINQGSAVEILSTKICTHFNRMNLEKKSALRKPILGNIKNNILMVGPTGVGKTYIIKLIAQKIGVPFVKADATKFTETGYVGGDVTDLVRDLVHKADGDIKKAEYGIIYIDEIDKIASSKSSYGPDVSRTGVQRNLLKLMEESEVSLRTPHDLASQIEVAIQAQKTGKVERPVINTRNILFVVSGAFAELDQIIEKRISQAGIGFNSLVRPKDFYSAKILKSVKTEDFIKYGFESEFIGRLPVIAILDPLDEDGLYKILSSENSNVILSKKLDFASYDIELEFSDESLKTIARLASNEKTGARGLNSVIEKILIKFEKKLPSTAVRQLYVDNNLIENPEEVLDELVSESVFLSFEENFYRKHKIQLKFDHDSEKIIRVKAEKDNVTVEKYLNKIFENYEYGLKLIQSEYFNITKEVATDPEEYLNNLIKTNYSKKDNS